ncbi:hypothetical protein EUX98_g6542 [Antrodiella citrinella]|uniref:Uncharacterized protein n=1 Tax=Antrodiella citrinella TaxID=2447956 RepID=A0A4V3XI29_9APHY|nr:hypothetical protein EUX98_g6542 [Antrodiella citrinella]
MSPSTPNPLLIEKDLRLRIACLSVLLCLKQSQGGRRNDSSNESSVSTEDKKQLQILNRFSAIFSRGVGQERDAAVAVVVNELNADCNMVTIGTTGRPTRFISSDGPHKSADDHIKPPAPHAESSLVFEDYVGTVVRSLHHCVRYPSDRATRSALESLVVNQCSPKIAKKCDHLLQRYFTGDNFALANWKPSEKDISFTFKPDRALVRLFKAYADKISAPAFVLTDLDAGTFQGQGAGLTVFRDVIKEALCEIRYKVQHGDPNTTADAIIRFHVILGNVPKEFWHDESLVTALTAQIPAGAAEAGEVGGGGDEDENDENEDDEDEDIASSHESGHEAKMNLPQETKFLLRDLERVTAPLIAIIYLLNRRIFRHWLPFKINIHSLMAPNIYVDDNSLSTQVLKFLDLPNWRNTLGLSADEYQRLRDMAIGKIFAQEFSRVTYHCEAVIMARMANEGCSDMRKVTIGVPRKCCPLCWELGNVLRVKQIANAVLPGHHGNYRPWIPPPKTSKNVLVSLEFALLKALKDMFQKARGLSHPLSPAVFDDDDDETIEYEEPPPPDFMNGRFMNM